MRVDVDAPPRAEWMSGRKALVTGGGGRDGGPGTVGWAIARLLARHVAAWSPAELFDIEPAEFDELLTANLKMAWQMTRHAASVMPRGGSIVNITPRRRMSALQTEGDCWDAAAAVLFLASDQARWISGQVLAVDGGGAPRAAYPGVKTKS